MHKRWYLLTIFDKPIYLDLPWTEISSVWGTYHHPTRGKLDPQLVMSRPPGAMSNSPYVAPLLWPRVLRSMCGNSSAWQADMHQTEPQKNYHLLTSTGPGGWWLERSEVISSWKIHQPPSHNRGTTGCPPADATRTAPVLTLFVVQLWEQSLASHRFSEDTFIGFSIRKEPQNQHKSAINQEKLRLFKRMIWGYPVLRRQQLLPNMCGSLKPSIPQMTWLDQNVAANCSSDPDRQLIIYHH